MQRRRRGPGCGGWGCLAAAAVLLSPFVMLVIRELGGPTTVTPAHDAMVGTWRSKDGATLTLAADGTYVAENIPPGTDDSALDPMNKPELPWGSGGWAVRPRQDGNDGGIDFTPSFIHMVELDTKGDAEHPVLFAEFGDPDAYHEYVFKKV